MIEFYVNGQTLKHYSPMIAADSVNALEVCFHISGGEWQGMSRWAHFMQGETVYDLALNEDDRITAESGLNLTAGEWTVNLTGNRGDSRMTTVPCIITVYESGLRQAPLHPIPPSVAEQIDSKASTALLMATAVKTLADSGAFNGRDGKGFTIAGYYDSLSELTAAITAPEEGKLYGVGTEPPYDIYAYDPVGRRWVNNGTIQGAPGARGERGATYTPTVDALGNLSWTNDGGLANPQGVNIKGAKGDKGETGAAGKSPYQAACDSGYTGTEATFNAALTAFPYHNARHAAQGADPITVSTGNLSDGCVTRPKLAAGSTHTVLTLTLSPTAWTDKQQTVTAAGVREDSTLIVAPAPGSHEEYCAAGVYATAQGADSLSFICDYVPETALTVNVGVLR